MTTKTMTRWGIGPKFGMLIALYAGLMYLLQNRFVPDWTFTGGKLFGMVVMGTGYCLFMYLEFTIDRYFHQGRLRTKGIYACVRHPIYASWIILILPGAVLYWGSILGFSIPFVAYLIFKKLIHTEEEYLIKKFGLRYHNYKDEVNAIFPRMFWLLW